MRASTKEAMPVYNVLTARCTHTHTHTYTYTHTHTHTQYTDVQMKKKKKAKSTRSRLLGCQRWGCKYIRDSVCDDTQHRRRAYRSGQLELRYSQDTANTANKNHHTDPHYLTPKQNPAF